MILKNSYRRLKALWCPEMFQGWGRSQRYFEGWYYKLVSADQKHALAIIPGVSFSKSGDHAFIQTMDGIRKKSRYERFSLPQFKPSDVRFKVNLGQNIFSDQALQVNLPHLHGRVEFKGTVPYQGSLLRPGIMGWYSFVPFMQCYHGLVSMDHRLSGMLVHEGQPVDFTGGKGYIEKDWGSSFPKAWVWSQCNHYDRHEDLSIMASVAHIPWLGSYFIGFLAVVSFQGFLKIFTTYTRAKMHLKLGQDSVKMDFWDRNDRLQIVARQEEGADLKSPQHGAMTGKVNESMQATHQVLLQLNDRKIRANGTTAGLEVGGNSLILPGQNG